MARDFTQPSTQLELRWCRYLPAYELADRDIAGSIICGDERLISSLCILLRLSDI
jgi:hypothetical protein